MRKGILGKKLGMTQIFTEEGKLVPVTVIEAGSCTILRLLKGKVMLGFCEKTEKNVSKPELGFYNKINLKPRSFVKEIEFDAKNGLSVGQKITVDFFKENDFVDITGVSIGKGFQGGVKRWNWRGGPSGHGAMHHKRVGSVGASSYPSRVLKGQRLPGRMGNEKKTVQNIKVLKVYKDKNLMFVKGPVPGPDNGFLEIKTAKKKQTENDKEPLGKKQDGEKK